MLATGATVHARDAMAKATSRLQETEDTEGVMLADGSRGDERDTSGTGSS